MTATPPDRHDSTPSDFLEEQEPHEPDVAQAQIAGLLDLLGPQQRRVLDLGCGAGRILVPLVQAGHALIGIDRDDTALRRCRENLALAGDSASVPVRLERGDFVDEWPADASKLDAVLCLGNTMMTVWEIDRALTLLRRVRAALGPRGVFVMDDCPGLFWPEVAEGRWRAGVSRDGARQMVWAPDDAVFSVRRGDRIDRRCWDLRPGDVRLRLWTRGAIDGAAAAAGLGPAHTIPGAWLLTLIAAPDRRRP